MYMHWHNVFYKRVYIPSTSSRLCYCVLRTREHNNTEDIQHNTDRMTPLKYVKTSWEYTHTHGHLHT